MSWTTEAPTRNGYYLWRICFPGEPPTVEPFMIYDTAGVQRVQELSAMRAGSDGGMWTLSEWLYKGKIRDLFGYPAQDLFIGGLDTEWQFVRAFRELYHAAVSANRDLMWTPDLSDNGVAVAKELAAAIDTIHKETN